MSFDYFFAVALFAVAGPVVWGVRREAIPARALAAPGR
jgi:hypothetical protein